MDTPRLRLAFAFLALMAAAGAMAAPAPCTIHPKKGASKSELQALAKISEGDARRAALGSLKDPSGASVKESELESEHGCLVFSFDIAIAGKGGIQEVQVDAGSGKVLSSEHESEKAEKAEKAREKTPPKP